MAKISEIKFDIKGEKFTVNTNCNSKGIFTAKIPQIVSEALNIHSELSSATHDDLCEKINKAIIKYKTAETTQELYIIIKYASYGGYNRKQGSDLGVLHNDSRFKIHLSFNQESVLMFDFKVCVKETVDNSVNWFNTRLGYDMAQPFDKRNEADPHKYYKYDKFGSVEGWIKIPYTEEAFINLSQAKEKIRMASETIFNFISKDESEISLILNSQKILS